jgi:hypothetical protein
VWAWQKCRQECGRGKNRKFHLTIDSPWFLTRSGSSNLITGHWFIHSHHWLIHSDLWFIYSRLKQNFGMTMDRRWSSVLVVGILALQSNAFQATPRLQTRTSTSTSALFYQNKTEGDILVGPTTFTNTGSYHNTDELYDQQDPFTKVGSYHNTGELDDQQDPFTKVGSYHNTDELYHQQLNHLEGEGETYTVDDTIDELKRFDEEIYALEKLDDFEDDFVMDYFEDGTPFVPLDPTLDMLKEWTQEYIDAVDMAGGGLTRVSVGVEMMLATDYVFTSPTIGPLSKPDFVRLMQYYRTKGLDLASAVPDLEVSYDGWHQDPHEPWRVWVVARYSGSHTGTAFVPDSGLRLTPPNHGERPARFTSGPEMQSFLWTPDKVILWQTMGYVGDEYTGSNQGHGGLDGLLVSLGLPRMYLDSISPMRKMKSWFSQFQGDSGEDARATSPYSRLPQWWHERKTYDLNIQK